MGNDRATRAERLDQRWIGSTDTMPVQVKPAVKAQRLHDGSLIDRAGKDDLSAGRVHDLFMVRIIIRLKVTQNDKCVIAQCGTECANHFQKRVFGLGAGNDYRKLSRFQGISSQ